MKIVIQCSCVCITSLKLTNANTLSNSCTSNPSTPNQIQNSFSNACSPTKHCDGNLPFFAGCFSFIIYTNYPWKIFLITKSGECWQGTTIPFVLGRSKLTMSRSPSLLRWKHFFSMFVNFSDQFFVTAMSNPVFLCTRKCFNTAKDTGRGKSGCKSIAFAMEFLFKTLKLSLFLGINNDSSQQVIQISSLAIGQMRYRFSHKSLFHRFCDGTNFYSKNNLFFSHFLFQGRWLKINVKVHPIEAFHFACQSMWLKLGWHYLNNDLSPFSLSIQTNSSSFFFRFFRFSKLTTKYMPELIESWGCTTVLHFFPSFPPSSFFTIFSTY